jgi:hypothetical protein
MTGAAEGECGFQANTPAGSSDQNGCHICLAKEGWWREILATTSILARGPVACAEQVYTSEL